MSAVLFAKLLFLLVATASLGSCQDVPVVIPSSYYTDPTLDCDDIIVQKWLLQTCPQLRYNFTRPAKQVKLNMTITFYRFLHLQTVERHMAVLAGIAMMWQTPCTKWNWNIVKSMNGTDQITERASKRYYTFFHNAWRPVIGHLNNVENNMLINYVQTWPNVKFLNTSIVQWIADGVYQSYCSLEFTRFPFDVQSCKIKFAIWVHSPDEVRFDTGFWALELVDEFLDKVEIWSFVDITPKVALEEIYGVNRSTLTYTVRVRRRPAYTYTAIFLPLGTMILIQIASLAMPPRKVDRAIVSATLIFGFFFTQTEIGKHIPKTSQLVYLSVYVYCHTIASCLITAYVCVACIFARVKAKGQSVHPARVADGIAFFVFSSFIIIVNGVFIWYMRQTD